MIDSLTQVGQNQPAGADFAPTRQPLTGGSHRGESVTQSANPVATLQDAAEELSFMHSEQLEKKLDKREIHDKARIKSFALEQAEKYLQQVPDLERDKKLNDFAKQALSDNKGGADPGKLRRSAREFSGDVTHQFLALSYTRDLARQEQADPALLAALDQALEGLQGEHGAAIQAGLNVSGVADGFSDGGLGDTQELRDFYRAVALDYSSVQDAYDKVLERGGDEKFPEAVNFLLKSLAADLAASNHSVAAPQLQRIMDDMYQLKLLNTLHEQCADLLERVRTNFSPAAATGPDVHGLMKELLAAQDKSWQGSAAFAALPQKLGIHGSEAEIYFLQGFKAVVRVMPLKVFAGEELKRERLLQSVQQALDSAIDNEEIGNE